jgi:hypothetical protein
LNQEKSGIPAFQHGSAFCRGVHFFRHNRLRG